MTGNGTQASPYIPADWDDLKTAAETESVYIKLPANAEWDMNDQYPSGAPGIALKCTEIDGNGATIRNLRIVEETAFTLSTVEHDVSILNVKFENVYCTRGRFFAAVSGQWWEMNMISLFNVAIGGEFYDANLWYCEHQGIKMDRCGLSFYLSNSNVLDNPGEMTNTKIELNGTITEDVGQLRLKSSGVYGSLRSYGAQKSFFFGGGSSVVDIELQNFYEIQSWAFETTIVINVDKIGDIPFTGEAIQATAAQMRDAAWLHDAGFPCVAG